MARSHLHKFGGSSLADADCYRRVVHILLTQGQSDDLVVVSAAGKTTNTLIELIERAQRGDDLSAPLAALQTFQLQLIAQLLIGDEAHSQQAQLNADFARLGQWLAESDIPRNRIQALGECWSARLLAAALRQLGVAAASLDSREFLTVTPGITPQPIEAYSRDLLEQRLVAQPNTRLVITGYIAADEQGDTVLLGRNGSDYSATLIGSLAGVEGVTIWTDVEGVFNADPNLLDDARLQTTLTLGEADRLARLGSPVLHPRTLQPLKQNALNLNVRSSYTPERPYTRILAGDADAEPVVTSLSRVALLHCETAPGPELARLFEQLEQQGLTALVSYPERGAVAVLEEQADAAEALLKSALGIQVRRDLSQGLVGLVSRNAGRLRGAFSRLLGRQAWPLKADPFALVTLVPAEQVADLTARVHRRCAGARKRIGLIVAGKGNIGSAWLDQFAGYQSRIRQDLEAELTLVAILGQEQALVQSGGIVPGQWQAQFDAQAKPYELDAVIRELAALPFDELVLLDITASARLSLAYPKLLEAGIHLVSANKQAGSGPLAFYQQLKQHLAERHLYWRYNATVGAGLPIFYALDDLRRSGDQLQRIDGVFSGTLSWLFHHYDGQRPFSELVLAAKAEGLTEPDPRDDLSGVDMQRKLLILARELGVDLELEEVALESLVPESLKDLPLEQFLNRINELDQPLADAVAGAEAEGKVLRYTAALSLEADKLVARVGLEAVTPEHPFASLPAGDNQFLLRSDYYPDGLVIQGPGAGRAVTAAAVQSDLVAICRRLLH
ncbi:bifunctional aspartate kinase/homoserine dehydrogenase II [Ferrimonas balearica]|uniref:bifunctional aspartate kinase/homoserine dehydrogenase II n=1 Tax=Ferrimonas balearica TaxID=44012 RepID=UPI001C997C2A|nr:bifunctional aspartate kinase/homoserine dehydrogenase II [Ferrimonas balearica]MBY5922545.1 bifunctional aspartate kinase/homoserine dehydrogenase II [Ferrimonas balearica]MBY5995529.1 bifunctional aspartate kinase/homoserine dehydrogenase II [Ferrimonas balearica]